MFVIALVAALVALLVTPAPMPDPDATFAPPPSTFSYSASAIASATPVKLLAMIRAKFRSHRPPPPYVVYTLERKQLTDQGFPDYAESYKTKYWMRSLDRAALTRRVLRSINRGEMIFDRPAFNESRDPGPPTADVFEPAPVHSRPISFVPTPEPVASQLPTIATITVAGEFDYRVDSITTEGTTLHLKILPTRDPDRNRLRELFVDKATLELEKLVATDKLFILGTSDVYGVTFTITMSHLAGVPVVTAIHGVVGDGYAGDGSTVDYTFSDIRFPKDLSSWYFDTKSYRQHEADEPR